MAKARDDVHASAHDAFSEWMQVEQEIQSRQSQILRPKKHRVLYQQHLGHQKDQYTT